MDENSSGKVMRDLIQMYTAKKFMELTHKEIRRAEVKLENYFTFIETKHIPNIPLCYCWFKKIRNAQRY